jgi:2-amino-4-hydroxy-6-hydroxymethyldihydropteridine diphosphokinase
VTHAVLALGSNLGDRAGALAEAVRRIADLPGVELLAASDARDSVALTPSGPDVDAPAYLNSVVAIETVLEPEQLLDAVNTIEADLGRVRGERWADRTIDIDMVVFGEVELNSARLTIPHPRAAERDFVLEPWLEIEPEAVIPGLGAVRDLAARLR